MGHIEHAIKLGDAISSLSYNKDYKENVVGKAPADLSLESYPQEKQACAASKVASEPLYRKDGKQQQTTGKLPNDCMEFVRTKNCNLIMSDANYGASREEAIKSQKAWQTMDVQTHPIVIQAHEAFLRNSDAMYKEDAKAGLEEMFYPVWATEGYEVAKAVSQATSNAIYYKEAKKIEAKNKYDYSQSDEFKQLKAMSKVYAPWNYSKDAKAFASKPKPIAEDDVIRTAKFLKPYQGQAYTKAAKKLAEKHHLTMDEI